MRAGATFRWWEADEKGVQHHGCGGICRLVRPAWTAFSPFATNTLTACSARPRRSKFDRKSRFSASETHVAWDTEPNSLPWSKFPGIPCNGDLARADRPGISGLMSRIGLDGIPSVTSQAASRANNPRLL